jgi:hypothetical protein
MLQVQRRADANPWVRVAVNLTAPQWQEPLRLTGSLLLVSVTPPLSPARP